MDQGIGSLIIQGFVALIVWLVAIFMTAGFLFASKPPWSYKWLRFAILFAVVASLPGFVVLVINCDRCRF